MFTGIVTHLGRVAAFDRQPGGAVLRVATAADLELSLGDSIAVSGCCLTVTSCDGQGFTADLSLETLRLTAFERRGSGQLVNLELPVRLADHLGGHLVQGHVDGLAEVISLAPEGDGHRLVVAIPPDLRRYVAVKGSLALDGISLTVAAYRSGQADVAVIPHTFGNTTLRSVHPGDYLHLEVDVIARYVEALTRAEEA